MNKLNLKSKTPIKTLIYCVLCSGILLFCACKDEVISAKVFKYNQINPITSLDPAFAKSQNNIWACHHMYNTLVRFDENLEIIPDLAKSYEISLDGLEYTFILEDSIAFHPNICFGDLNTRFVNAHDVLYSLNRLIDPKIQSPGSWLFKEKLAPEGFVVLNDSSFQISLSKPFAPFLSLLANQYCCIIPQEAVDFYGKEFRKNPVGTGPFILKRWLENEALFLRKNETYFRPTIYIDAVKVSFITDRKMAYLALLNGETDLVSGIESSFLHRLLEPDGKLKESNEGLIQYKKSPFLNTEYLGINLQAADAHSPLHQKAFRQALNYGIDKKLMLEVLRNNIGNSAEEGFIPFGLPSYAATNKGYSYNPQKAQELLASCDLPDFKDQEPIIINTNADYLDIVTFVAKQWENIGVKVEIEVFESALLREGMRSGKLALFRASWIADYPDGENFLCLFYGENPAPPNYTRFINQEVDALFKRATEVNDPDERKTIYQEIDNIIIEEAPVIFLFYDESSLFTSKRIENIQTNALNLLELENLKMLKQTQ